MRNCRAPLDIDIFTHLHPFAAISRCNVNSLFLTVSESIQNLAMLFAMRFYGVSDQIPNWRHRLNDRKA